MPVSLLIQGARFGDLCQTKRLILSLLAQGEVHIVVDRVLLPLAKLLYPNICTHGFVFHGVLDSEAILYNRKTLQTLHSLSFDTIINCNLSPLTTTITRLFDQEILGYAPRKSSDGGVEPSPFLKFVTRFVRERAKAPLNLVDLWAHFIKDPIPPQKVNPLPQSGGGGLGIVLQGQEKRRTLPIEHWVAITRIYAKFINSPKIFLLGTNQDSKVAKRFCSFLPKSLQEITENLCGKTDWAGLMDALRGLDYLLTPDTGTMHLACILGVPVRAFFLSSAFCFETGPYGEGERVFQAIPPCAPCLEAAPCMHHEICHSSFASPSFLRSLTLLEENAHPTHQNDSKPQEILFLTSTLDTLGCTYQPIIGEDPNGSERTMRRIYLAQKLGIPLEEAQMKAFFSDQTTQRLEMDADFMLDGALRALPSTFA